MLLKIGDEMRKWQAIQGGDGSAIGLDWNAIYRELNTIQLQWNTANTGEVFNEVFSGMNTLQQVVVLDAEQRCST